MLLTPTEEAKATLAQKATQNATLWSGAFVGRSIALSVFHSGSVLFWPNEQHNQLGLLRTAQRRPKRLPNTVAVFTKQNLFAKAVHAAFYGHHPLVLSPDVI